MSGLPNGWEADYDGTRWFYRYKSTGIVQYQFPKEGDEFPEWFDGGDEELEPEAWLASEQQIRRKSTLVSEPDNPGELSPAKPTSSRRKKSETIPEDEQMGATGYFDPSSFMYFGPGGDISPVGDDNDANSIASGKRKGETPTQSAGPTPSTVHSHISPGPGLPAELAQTEFVAELPEHPGQLWKPTGYVAELPTLDTVKCAEELAPIEMDGTSHIPTPIQTDYADSGPAELPTHRSPVEPKGKEPEALEAVKTSPPVPSPPIQQTASGEYPLVSASFAYPPVQQQNTGESIASKPQSPQQSLPAVPSREQAPAVSLKPAQSEPEPIVYQPWTPPQGVTGRSPDQSKRSSLVLSGMSILQSQESEFGPIRKLSGNDVGSSHQSLNHPEIFAPPRDPRVRSDSVPASIRDSTVGGHSRSTPPRSPIPASLQPAGTQKRVSLPDVPDLSKMATSQPQRHDLPGSSARHESISSSSVDQIVVSEYSDSHTHPRALTPAGHGPKHMPSSPDLDARKQRQIPPERSTTAFSAYDPLQRPTQSSPLAPEGSQSAYQRPPLNAGGWSSSLDRPIPPPGPRRLHTEPNLPVAANVTPYGFYQQQGLQELSSESVHTFSTGKLVLTETQRAHIAQASPSPPIIGTSADQLPYPTNDNAGVPDIRPLSLTRSKSPSPETCNVASFDAQNRPLRGMSTDILSEVMSVMDESIGSSRRESGNVSVVSPVPSDATQHRPSEVSLLSQNTGTSAPSISAGYPSRERDSLSVPSELDSSHVSPLVSPVPSRQQSLSNTTQHPAGHGTDPRRATVLVDGPTSPRNQVSPLPLRQQLASSPRIQQQQLPPADGELQTNMSDGPQVVHQQQTIGSAHTLPTQSSANMGASASSSPMPQDNSLHLHQGHREAPQIASQAAFHLPQTVASTGPATTANDATGSTVVLVQPEPPQTQTAVPENLASSNNTSLFSQGQHDGLSNARQQDPQQAYQQQPYGLQIGPEASQASRGANVSSIQGVPIAHHDQVEQPQYNFEPSNVLPVKAEERATGSPPASGVPSQIEQPNMSLPLGVMMLTPRHTQGQPPAAAESPAANITPQQQAFRSSIDQKHSAMTSPILPHPSSLERTTEPSPAFSHPGGQPSATQQVTPQGGSSQNTNQGQEIPAGQSQSIQNVMPPVLQEQTAAGGLPQKSDEPIPLLTGGNPHEDGVNEDGEKPPEKAEDSPKPYPMLPGQVTPLPSQVGSAPVPLPNPPAPTSPVSPRHDSTSGQVNQMTPQNTGPSQHKQSLSNQSDVIPAIVKTAPTPTQSNPPNGFAQQWQGQGTQQGQIPQYQQAPQQQWQQPASPGLPQSASNSSITDAGKSMKKWAKKMFSSEKLSSQSQQSVPSPPIPSQGNSVLPQGQMYRPPSFQQTLGQQQQVPGVMPQGQMPQIPTYKLPVRAQPPLKPVPEESAAGAQGIQMMNTAMNQASRQQQPSPQQVPQPSPVQNMASQGQGRGGRSPAMMQGMAPQSQGTGAPLPSTAPPSHVHMQQQQQQRPAQPTGQPPMGLQGQFKPQVYHQQQQKAAAPGLSGYSQGQMAMRPMNANASGGQVQPQQRPQGQPQTPPVPGGVPANNGARPSSGSFSGPPPQGRGGAIPYQMQMNPQGRGQMPTQPPTANPAGIMPQQAPNMAPRNGQVQGYAVPMQGRPVAHGPQGQQGQVYTSQAGQTPPQNMMSFAQRQSAHGPFNQAGPATAANKLLSQQGPSTQPPSQEAGPVIPGVAPSPSQVSTGNASGRGHKKSWSKGKVDYEGGDWGDAW